MDNFTRPLRQGDQGRDVKLAQEWLNFHGFATAIDSKFGPATANCVERFRAKSGLPESQDLDPGAQRALLAPMVAATQKGAPGNHLLLDMVVVTYAQRHLRQHPVEIGGQNAGPWVRLYMDGNEGPQWPWCAGFATYILREASSTARRRPPHPYAFGCDYLAGVAQANDRFFTPKTREDFDRITPGFLFLVRKTRNSWSHIGIVETVSWDLETMTTIEGNTNDSGSAEGFEVCRRTRSLRDKDYLMI